MIDLRDKRFWLIEDPSELPSFECEDLYLDFETTSFDSKVEAFFPYSGHRIAGIAVTWDDNPQGFYVPIRHTNSKFNLPLDKVLEWLKYRLSHGKRWINSNLKFDAHFAVADGVEPSIPEWIDTVVFTKLYDSDRYSHSLKSVCRDWLGYDIGTSDKVSQYLTQIKSKNFGDCPADLAGEYACDDVFMNRDLWRFLKRNLPEELQGVMEIEKKVTLCLFDMEREGLLGDRRNLLLVKRDSLTTMIDTASYIAEVADREFTNHPTCIHDILCNQFGLPVLERTWNKEKHGFGGPSFTDEVLEQYLGLGEVVTNEELTKLVVSIQRYRKAQNMSSLFCDSYLDLSDKNGVVHPSFNQTIRTARTSCSKPNIQQADKRAKQLIIPKEGEGFLVADASQVEFRFIVHYTKDDRAIEAYRTNPKTDYHSFVTEICGLNDRSSGKTINFGMAFGMGVKKLTKSLAATKEIRKIVLEEMEEKGLDGKDIYNRICNMRAKEVFYRYHSEFPGIKITSKYAAQLCRMRGYVKNVFGRRRHLPTWAAHKAFNTANQSSAGDFVKTRMVATSPRYNPQVKKWGVKQSALVHDELVFNGPDEILRQPKTQDYFREILETVVTPKPLRVPILWELGYSTQSWYHAKEAAL